MTRAIVISVGAEYNAFMQTEKLQVETRASASEEVVIIRMAGSLTLGSCYEAQDLLRANPDKCLIVDLADVRFVDSSGIGCLVNGYIAHHMAGGRMVLAGVNKRLRETLEETRVIQFFTIYATQAEAEREVTKSTVRSS